MYGLGQEIIDIAFAGSVSKIGGLTLDEVIMTNLGALPLSVDWA